MIPKARRVLDFDREDGGDKVPTSSWSQLSRHELKRIFPNLYDKDKTTAKTARESEDLPVASSTASPIPLATSTTKEVGGGKKEFRCDRCGRMYQYLNFLKVHQRRPCS